MSESIGRPDRANPDHNDQDAAKGATETGHNRAGNSGLQDQIGHRDPDPMLKGADTDFPEPGENPEHTGEAEGKGE
jgi:hypothetical protein